MHGISWSKWISAAAVGISVTVGFDAVLHGLSHGGHGILDFLWDTEASERITQTSLVSSVTWHVVADVFLYGSK